MGPIVFPRALECCGDLQLRWFAPGRVEAAFGLRAVAAWALSSGLAATTLLSPAHAGQLEHWHWRNPGPFADRMLSVAFGAGKFVAVGEGGVIHVSVDGATWDDGRRPGTNTLFKVIYGDNLFVAVGGGGTLLTSPDGLSWTKRASGTTNTFSGAAYGNGKFLACGNAGQVASSTEGLHWTSAEVASFSLTSVAAGNGAFVIPVPPTLYETNGYALVSSDGATWNKVTVFTAYPYMDLRVEAVEFGNGHFTALVQSSAPTNVAHVATQQIYTSTDGSNWVSGPVLTGYFYNAAVYPRFLNYANGLFWTVLGSTLDTSDGSSSSNYLLADAVDANGLAYGAATYVIAGNAGKILTSTDGTNWVAAYVGSRGAVKQLRRDATKYVAVGSPPGQMLVSYDGLAFNDVTGAPPVAFADIGYGRSNFVAVAGNGGVYTSSNGVNWLQATRVTTSDLYAVCRGQTRWVAVGWGGTILTSPTGAAWTVRSSGTGFSLNAVAYGNGIYVVVGYLGAILTSSDGALWEAQYSGTTAALNSVRFLNGQFYAVGATGTILCSPDGINWTALISGTGHSLSGIAFGNGTYVAAGADTSNVVLQSTNGVDWQDITTHLPASVNLASVNFLGGSFWLSGDNGCILQSDTVDGQPLLSGGVLPGNGGFKVAVVLNAPDSYVIQSTTSLGSAWQDVLAVTNPAVSHVWIDTNAPAAPIRLYRLKGTN